jgi:uncharacterized protein YggU (UPF0235/DUF167 family)
VLNRNGGISADFFSVRKSEIVIILGERDRRKVVPAHRPTTGGVPEQVVVRRDIA